MWDHFVTHLQALFTGAPVCQSPHFLDQNALFYSQCFSHWLCRVTVCNTLHGHGRLESIIDKDCFFFHCHVGMHVSPSTSVPLYLLFSSFLLKYIYIFSCHWLKFCLFWVCEITVGLSPSQHYSLLLLFSLRASAPTSTCLFALIKLTCV